MSGKKEELVSLLNKDDKLIDYGSVYKNIKKGIIEEQEEDIKSSNSPYELITSVLTKSDKFLIIMAITCTVICGICPPILGYFVGAMTNVYVRHAVQSDRPSNFTDVKYTTIKPEFVRMKTEQYNYPVFKNETTVMYEVVDVIRKLFQKDVLSYNIWDSKSLNEPITNSDFVGLSDFFSVLYVILGTVLFISTFFQSILWEYASKRISRRLQQLLHNQVIMHELSWHSSNSSADGSLDKLFKQLHDIQVIIQEDFSSIVQYVSTFISGFVVGLSVNPRLTLVTSCIAPFLLFLSGYKSKLTNHLEENESDPQKATLSNYLHSIKLIVTNIFSKMKLCNNSTREADDSHRSNKSFRTNMANFKLNTVNYIPSSIVSSSNKSSQDIEPLLTVDPESDNLNSNNNNKNKNNNDNGSANLSNEKNADLSNVNMLESTVVDLNPSSSNTIGENKCITNATSPQFGTKNATSDQVNSTDMKWFSTSKLIGKVENVNSSFDHTALELCTDQASDAIKEILTNVKTVCAFGKQASETQRYKSNLNQNLRNCMGIHKKVALGVGLTSTLQFLSYCLAFYYGSYLIQIGTSTPGSVFTIFFSIISGSFSIVNILPSVHSVNKSSNQIASIAKVVNRKSKVDGHESHGLKLVRLTGNIEYRNVTFSYPTDPQTLVLKDLNLSLEPSKVTAIAGYGARDISSIFQLFFRHYEPTDGQICLDDVPINDFNVNWLRKQVSLIPKETALFSVSIAENIRYGKSDATFEEIQQAARLSDVEKFITTLPDGYDTVLNDEDIFISKADRRKIILARALISNPKIMFFEEAICTFNDQEELVFQQLLDYISKDHTIVFIPDRIRNAQYADFIYVIKDGSVAECGTHQELMDKHGLYEHMVATELDFESNNYSNTTNAGGEDALQPKDELQIQNKSPSELFKEYSINEDKYDIKFRLPQAPDDSDVESIDEPRSDPEDDVHVKILKRSVSQDTISELGDDEYETVITRVRELKKISYDSDDDDENSETEEMEEPAENLETLKKGGEPMELEPADFKNTNEKFPSWKEIEKNAKELAPKYIFKEKDISVSWFDLVILQKPEWLCLIVTFICCLIVGFTPAFIAFYYGKVYQIYTLHGNLLKDVTLKWALIFVIVFVVLGISLWIQTTGILKTSELLVRRMRIQIFENVLHYPIAAFDTSFTEMIIQHLTEDVPTIKEMSLGNMGYIFTCIVTVVCSLLVSYFYGWFLAVILFASVPVIFCLSYIQKFVQKKKQDLEMRSKQNSEKAVAETLNTINVIQELGQEKKFSELFDSVSKLAHNSYLPLLIFCSLLTAAIQSAFIYLYSVGFTLGSRFVEEKKMSTSGVYMVYFSVYFCTAVVSNCFTRTRNYIRAERMFESSIKLIKKKSDTESISTYGAKPKINGKISFHNISFSYTTDDDAKALDSINFAIQPGKVLAFFGDSKCGKSTIGYLIERFYDPSEGFVKVDDYDIRNMNISHLRCHIGFVMQDPVLFSCSIRENIAYGSAFPVSDDKSIFFEIQKAAKLSNVHNFIINLPQGYDTMIGNKGIELTNDQKRRIAIARALVRDPKILILDEPTYMLNAEDSKIVQKAVENAIKGRTAIIMSRNAELVRSADTICTLYKGRILEEGTHQQLMEQNNYYSRLLKH